MLVSPSVSQPPSTIISLLKHWVISFYVLNLVIAIGLLLTLFFPLPLLNANAWYQQCCEVKDPQYNFTIFHANLSIKRGGNLFDYCLIHVKITSNVHISLFQPCLILLISTHFSLNERKIAYLLEPHLIIASEWSQKIPNYNTDSPKNSEAQKSLIEYHQA